MRHGLVLGSHLGRENTFCTYQVFYLAHITVVAMTFIYGFMNSKRIVYFRFEFLIVLSQTVPVSRKIWDKETVIRAVRIVRAGQMGYKRAAKQSVYRKILKRYIKDDTRSLNELAEVNHGRRSILRKDVDSQLVKYCIELDAIYYGLRRNDGKRMAFQLTVRNCYSKWHLTSFLFKENQLEK
jgi:hypothetical protein